MVLLNQADLQYNSDRYTIDILSEGLKNGKFTQHGGKIILQIIFNVYNENRDEINFASFIVLRKAGEQGERYCTLTLEEEQDIFKLLSFDSKLTFNL